MFPLLIALACGPKTEPRTGDVPAPETQDINWEQAAFRLHMSEHYKRSQSARNHVLAGDLQAAREDLAWLATHETFEGEPDAYGNWLKDMRVIAQTGVEARDTDGMAACITGIAVDCGGCHQSLDVQPSMPVNEEPPANTGGVKGHIARHGWVADRMWVALAQPSDVAWRDAVHALREPPMSVYDLGIPEDLIEQVSPYADKLNALATRARAEAEPADRAATYGEVVTVCAECHGVVKGKTMPTPPSASPMPELPEAAPMPEQPEAAPMPEQPAPSPMP